MLLHLFYYIMLVSIVATCTGTNLKKFFEEIFTRVSNKNPAMFICLIIFIGEKKELLEQLLIVVLHK